MVSDVTGSLLIEEVAHLSRVFDPAALPPLLEGVASADGNGDGEMWEALLGTPCNATLCAFLNSEVDQIRHQRTVAAAPLPERLAALRAECAKLELDGLIIPRADRHLSKMVTADAEQLAWLTGFTGSAGTAVLHSEHAALFVDGRYVEQARGQTDGTLFAVYDLREMKPEQWLAAQTGGTRIGAISRFHAMAEFHALRHSFEIHGLCLVTLDSDPIASAWSTRPAAPLSPVRPHPLRYAGRSSTDKRQKLAADLDRDGIDAAVIIAAESVAWLLNVRGNDVSQSPLVSSFVILHRNGSIDWFVDLRKIGPGVLRTLDPNIHIHPEHSFAAALEALGTAGRCVAIDSSSTPQWHVDRLAGAVLKEKLDPCVRPRARKSAIELDGMRNAHRRDGRALVRFLAWFDTRAAQGGLDELAAASAALDFRAVESLYRGPSFIPIAAAGAHAAMPHYRAERDSNATIVPGQVFLLDSGGHYLDGTTDITRVVAVGDPPEAARTAYTLVLKGHIALATARFPAGTRGVQLDALARQHLWRRRLDYDHGTGHGVGSYLNVHEGPASLSTRIPSEPLEPGMILSNEPGYYVPGAFGIRLENLVAVREAGQAENGRPFLEFETISIVPFDRRMIDLNLLDSWERNWINSYHARVRTELLSTLDEDDARWLSHATAPL